MNNTPRRPVVVGVDGSDSARQAVRWAAAAAVRHRAPMQLVAVVNTAAFGVAETVVEEPDWLADLQQLAIDHLVEATELVAEVSGQLALERHTPVGSPVAVLRQYSESARMVVVGTRGFGAFTSTLVGSTASGLDAHSACSVVVVRSDGQRAYHTEAPVVVGVDGSKASEYALGIAFDEAAKLAAPLVAVHTWSDIPLPHDGSRHWQTHWENSQTNARYILTDMLQGWNEYYPDVVVRKVVVRDRPVRYLVEHSEAAQLLVVGSHGRGGFSGMLLGSTSQALLHVAPCPLLIARTIED